MPTTPDSGAHSIRPRRHCRRGRPLSSPPIAPNAHELALVAPASAIAVGDWVAVHRGKRVLEYACKPLAMVALLAAATVITPADPSQRAWFLAALSLSMLGDVFLMLPERRVGPADTFTFGLAAFLLGHLAYVAGFVARGLGSAWLFPALIISTFVLATVGVGVIRGAKRHDATLAGAVTVYMLVLVAMLDVAWSSGVALAMIGAALFVASDAMIGCSRFVAPFPYHRLCIIVTYHLAQGLLVLSLA